MSERGYAGDVTSRQAWDMLERDPRAMLIDVRTNAEWAYVGMPDLGRLGKQPVPVSWLTFPDMAANPRFVAEVAAAGAPQDAPLLMLCRSGARSASAAVALTRAGFALCYNIADGFEGDKDANGHRGAREGWKVAGLPWMQG